MDWSCTLWPIETERGDEAPSDGPLTMEACDEDEEEEDEEEDE